MTLLPPTAPHPHLSPRQLQVASYLYGLDTPNLDTATVLELGCDQGQNLLAFAYSHPLAKAIGIDLDPETISLGQQQLTNKDITNIELHALDLAQLIQTDLPLCDYIIVRGLFAQTDLETRLQLLNHCRQFLSPNGVIVIQYAVYPGSKALDGIFDSLALHSAQSEADPEHQLQALRAMLGFMAEGMSKDSANAQAIQASIEQLEQQSDQELYLAALGGLYHPCYFIEFASQLDEAGLCYIGDADPASELPERISGTTNTLMHLINPEQNKILTQQYLDTLTQKPYRYSLLSHRKHIEEITSLPNTKKVADLHWAGYFLAKPNSSPQNPVFETQTGSLLQTPHEISQHIFSALGDAWPYSLDIKAITRQAAPVIELLDDINNPTAQQQVEKTLEQIFIHSSQHLFLSKHQGPYNSISYDHLSLEPLKKLHYAANPIYVNLWNQKINLNNKNESSLYTTIANKVESIEDVSNIDNLNKNGLIFSNFEAWKTFYLQAFKIINAIEDSDISLCASRLLTFTFHENFFKEKNNLTPRKPFISNKNLTFIENNINDCDSIFIKKVNKKDLTNIEKACIYSLFIEKKVGFKKLKNESLIKKCIELDSDNYFYYLYLSYIAFFIESKDYYWLSRKVFVLNNNDYLLLSSLADFSKKYKKIENAISLYRKSKEIKPNNISNINNFAVFLSEIGRTDEALQEYEKILNSISPVEFSNYLFIALHSNYYNEKELFNAHRRYGKGMEKWASKQKIKLKPFNKSKSTEPLRVGFVSGDFRNHPVAKFLLPYWEGLDQEKFHLYAYYTYNAFDHITKHLKEKSKKWTNAYSFSYTELAQAIRDDNIDILIDLSGHTSHNYLPTFALKPAPVQMTWIGYPATTGLKAMDYIFANDFYYNNKDFTWQFTEKFLCLKSTSSIFDHGVNLPPRTDYIPVKINNHFTFASFNRPQKISNEVLETWAKIMIGCPGDKLLLANMPDDETITAFKEKIISFGAKESQLIFKKRCSLYDYLNLHNEVDLLLDTFPYAGGTTSVHAISMGVATIYLKGKTMASNPLIYNRYNLSDFGANNIEEYIEKTIYHSKDHERLQNLRENLKLKSNNRKRSPVELFEKSLEYVWENYCLGNPARSTIIN